MFRHQVKRFARSLIVISIELLDDAGGILDDLLVSLWRVLSEGLNDTSDAHFLKSPSALFVNTEISDGEQSDTAWRLRRALIMGNNVKKLLESPVADKILAESIRVANKVAKSTSCVSPSLFFLVLEQVYEKFDTGAQVLIQDFIVEASVSNRKAGEFPCVPVWVLAASNCSLYQAMLQ